MPNDKTTPLFTEEKRTKIAEVVTSDKDVLRAAQQLVHVLRRNNFPSGNAKEDQEFAKALPAEQENLRNVVRDEVTQRVAPKGAKKLTDEQKKEIALIQDSVMTHLSEAIGDAASSTPPKASKVKAR